MTDFTPADWIELTKVTFAGLGTVLGGVAAVYAVIGAKRAGRAEATSKANSETIGAVQTNVERVERNTNSISTRNEAIAKALGVEEGIKTERARGIASAAALVEGGRAAVATERESIAATAALAPPVEDQKRSPS